MKKGFTLAEVLITLGIIGVVAALTLPTIIQNSRNSEVETSLKKIYSTMNQAILMSESQNGPREYWPYCSENSTFDECVEFYNNYIFKYLKNIDKTKLSTNSNDYYLVYLADGSLIAVKRNDFFFYPHAKNYNSATLDDRSDCGITYFAFRIGYSSQDKDPGAGSRDLLHYGKGFEPYKRGLNELTYETLTDPSDSYSYTCNKNSTIKVYCTALIQFNNWKIPKDYPFKVK